MMFWLALVACDRDLLYSDATFSNNVARAFEECNAGEIRFLAAKHNMQMVFDYCGSNNFSHFAWSPDGLFVYFQTTQGAFLMNADKKQVGSVPIENPSAGAAWAKPNLLVAPLPPVEGQTQPRIVYYGLPTITAEGEIAVAGTMETHTIDVQDVQDLMPWGADGTMMFTAKGADGVRAPYYIHLDGSVKRALPWLTQPVTRLMGSKSGNLIAWSTKTGTVLSKADDGTEITRFDGSLRGNPHPEGRYIALERMGQPISPFDQRAWDEVSPEQRRRELQRQEQWLERLPEWAPRELEPPEILIYDTETSKLYNMTGFYGDQVAWYPAPAGYYLSFMMWGIEGKQLHRNVTLVNVTERFRMMDKGQQPLGTALISAPDTAEGSPPPKD